MSDAGGEPDLNAVTLTFDDGACASLPDSSQIASGAFKPTNFKGAGITFPSPAPSGTLGDALSVFTNRNPNGTWSLFVLDDQIVDSGSIASWSLNLYLTPTVSLATNVLTIAEDTPVTVNVTVKDTDTPADSLTVSGVSSDTNIVANASIVSGGSGEARTLTITPKLNAFGTTTITVRVGDGLATVTTDLTLNVTNVNDAPTITLATNQITTTQGVLTTNVIAVLADVDTSVDNLVLSSSSSSPSVVGNSNVFFSPGTNSNSRFFTIAPTGAATGTATVTIYVSDGSLTNSATIDVTVNPVPQAVFANSGAITINDDARATPYPSSVVVSNVTGLIGRMSVVLADVSHPRPDDISVLLVGPGGQTNVMLMRQAGGANPVEHQRLTFEDVAANPIPNSSQITTGSFQPADYNPGTVMPTPAPAGNLGNYGDALSVFNGTNPNNTWSLYVVDTGSGQAGTINGGWLLNIYPAPTISAIADQTMAEDGSLTVNFVVGDFDGTVTNVTRRSVEGDVIATSGITLGGSGANRTLTITPILNASGTNTIEVTAQDNNGFTVTRSFKVGVTAVNDAPTIPDIPRQITTAGVPVGPVSFAVGDVDNAPANLIVSATSSNQKLLPNSNILLGGSGTTRNFRLFPVGTQAGTADVTVSVFDGSLTTSTTFSLVVMDAANPIFENASTITINNNSTATPYPSTLAISNLLGNVAEVKVTLFGITHPKPNDLDILLVGPGGKVILMSDNGGTNALTDTALVFADSAVTSLPTAIDSQIVSGTFKPSNFDGTPDTFVSPAPGSPYSSTLSVFNGTTPNGVWSLYVVDSSADSRGGVINQGWQLSIRTTPSVSVPTTTQTTLEDTPIRVTVSIGDSQPGVPLTVTAVCDTPSLVSTTNIVISGTGSTRTLTITPNLNQFRTNTPLAAISVTVSDTDTPPHTSTGSFLLAVVPVDDPVTISHIADQNTRSAVAVGPISFTVADPETGNLSDIPVSASSSDQSLVPDANITLGGSGGNRTITVLPAGVLTGTATITVTALDGEAPHTQKSSTTFQLTVTTNLAFANTRRIIINDDPNGNAIADPYPAVISVQGVVGAVSQVTVTLDGFSHPFPEDVDVLLVSPDNSKKVALMTHAGGSNSVSNLRLNFSDAAATQIPTSDALTSDTFRPGDYGTSVTLPAPAPGRPYSTSLADFNGLSPNGDWKLYVLDDTFPDGGIINNGWILVLQTSPTISPIATQSTREDTPLTVPFTVNDSDTIATNLVVRVSNSADTNNSALLATNLVLSGTSTDRSLLITPTTNMWGTNQITLAVTDGTTTNSTSFSLIVIAVDDPPVINTATNALTINEDSSTNISFTIPDVDSILAFTNIVVTSSDSAIVPGTNIVITGGITTNAPASTATVNVAVRPFTNAFGTVVLTLSVTDGPNTVTKDVTLNVNAVNDGPTISSIVNQNVQSGSSTTNIAFTVNDVETPARNLTVAAFSSDQSLVPNSNISLGGGAADRTITLTPVGNGTGPVTISLFVSDGALTNSTSFVLNVTAAPGANYANTTAITIPSRGNAQLYPSTITVGSPSLVGVVYRVFVTLEGITHNAPDDLDILLVHTNSNVADVRKVLLLSDVGGANAINNVRLRFDDLAPGLGDDNPIVSGNYHPSNFDTTDTFDAPAPAGPYGDSLSVFKDVNPNGVWALYVTDDTAPDGGSIAQGWTLTVVVAPTITSVSPTSLDFDEDGTRTLTLNLVDGTGTPLTNLVFNASSDNTRLLPNDSVTFDTGLLANGTVTARIQPAANEFGTNNLTLTALRRTDGATATVVVPMNVRSVNDAPTISRLTTKTTAEDQPLSIDFIITDVDSASTNLSLLVTNSTTTGPIIISNTNMLIFGVTNFYPSLSTKDIKLTLVPNLHAVGTNLITVTVTDNAGNPTVPPVSSTFAFVVTQVNNPPTITAIPSPQTTFAGQPTTNIVFTVDDPEALPTGSETLTVTATSSDQTIVKNSSIVVSPAAGPRGSRTVQVTPEQFSLSQTNATVTITLSVSDGTLNTSTDFTLNVRQTRERIFSNSRPITINPSGPATDYPSVVTVSGLVGNISKVRVFVNGFKHSFPDDVDILLVSPTGQKVVLMSDAGGANSVTNINLVLDDAAANAIPDNTTLTNGVYKPSNYESTNNDNFVTPAPAGPYSAVLSAFNGVNPEGNWSLYVVDDTPSDAGLISNGWSLGITTEPVINGLTDLTTPEDTTTRQNFTIAEESFATADFTITATSTNTALVATNGITFSGSGTNWTMVITPVANAFGTNEITVNVNNADGQTARDKFILVVTPVNDAPSITQVADTNIFSGSVVAVNFNYDDAETVKRNLRLTVQSSNVLLIPTNNINIVGNTLTIVPVGDQTGNSQITITVTDDDSARPLSASTTFVVGVSADPRVFANSTGIVLRDNTTASPYPSTIDVGNLRGNVSKVTVTLVNVSHPFPDDIDLLLVGPAGQKVVLMSDAGGGGALSNVRLSFDDAAAAGLPDNSLIASGTYKPSNFEGADSFAAPAPAGPYASALNAFNGTDPNGTWSLYAVDDTQPDAGSISGGWFLRIETTVTNQPPVITGTGLTNQTIEANETLRIDFTVTDADTDVTNLTVAATSSNAALGTVAVTGTTANRTLVFTPNGSTGVTTIRITAADDLFTVTNSFELTVVAPPCLSLSLIGDRTIDEDQTTQVGFTVSNAASTNLTLSGTSDNASLVAAVTFGGSGNNRTATVTLVPDANGTATVTITASDGFCTNSTGFFLTVRPVNDPPVLGPLGDRTTAENTPVTITLSVSDKDTPLASLTYSASSDNTTLLPGQNVTFNTNSLPTVTATLTPVAGQSGQATVTISVSDGGPVPANQSFLLTVGSAAAPTLGVSRTGNSLTISWDSTATGFILEAASSLVNPTWTAVPGVANNSVTITIGSANQFFRLRKP